MKHISEIIKQIKDKNPHWVEYNKTQLKNYYCENCGDDDLDTPIHAFPFLYIPLSLSRL